MKVELFPFQQKAVNELRECVAAALDTYHKWKKPQIISLQAPTGSGKTIIMSALIEDIYFGTEKFVEQPEAIFVWLSDSPALNDQSRQKIELKADKIRPGQCVTIEADFPDVEMLADGHIYFLNTQKLSKPGKLGKQADRRTHTIWEVLDNTAREKADHFYFIIDEAHRGAQGKTAGLDTTIMQKFLKGAKEHGMCQMPLVIGVSATPERFHLLVEGVSSSLNRVIVTPGEVKASGLLKDRILLTYPEDPSKNNDMAVLQTAAEEWKRKCVHWHRYCAEQNYPQVNPVFIIQVQAGTKEILSETDLNDVIAKIEQQIGERFQEYEVVHTFGSKGTITMNGLNVHYVAPEEIADDKRIKVVLFKENLSTGWDCPRAETMMSFRRAEDATYIAQLLGRMVRTPLQCHIRMDDYLNDVRLYLPYFDRATTESIVNALLESEVGEIPTFVDVDVVEKPVYDHLTIYTDFKGKQCSGQECLFPETDDEPLLKADDRNGPGPEKTIAAGETEPAKSAPEPTRPVHPQNDPLPTFRVPVKQNDDTQKKTPVPEQLQIPLEINRKEIVQFINSQGLITYEVRAARNHSYLKSLLDLAALLTHWNIYRDALCEVKEDVAEMIHDYCEQLKARGEYDKLSDEVLQLRLLVDIFDVFGEPLQRYRQTSMKAFAGADLEGQLRAADAKMGRGGFCNYYGQKYGDAENEAAHMIDCILFAMDERCMAKLKKYAETKFNELNDDYRRKVVNKSERCKEQYDSIVSNSGSVTKHNFCLPETIEVKKDDGGKCFYKHLYAREDGTAQIKLDGGWEEDLIEEESRRNDFVCWLRNPPREKWSLCLPYEMAGETKATYPDFLIVRSNKDVSSGEGLKYIVDILEPHGSQYKDNLGKAKALAQYAEDECNIGRVQLIRQTKNAAGKNCFVRLDMSKGSVRKKVLKAINTDEIDYIFDTDGFIEPADCQAT